MQLQDIDVYQQRLTWAGGVLQAELGHFRLLAMPRFSLAKHRKSGKPAEF